MGAENSIDSINLNITSSTSSAETSLSNLVTALDNLGKSLGGVDTSAFTRKMTELENSYDSLAKRIANNPIKIKFGFDTGSEKANLKSSIEEVFSQVKLDNKGLAKNIASAFQLKEKDVANVETVLNSIAGKMASSFDGARLNIGEDIFGADWENLEKIITEKGSVLNTIFRKDAEKLQANLAFYEQFAKEMRRVLIYTNSNDKAETGAWNYVRKEFPGMFTNDRTKKGAVQLDSVWSSWADSYPGIIDGNLTTVPDMLMNVIDALRKYREAKSQAYSVRIKDLSAADFETAGNEVAQKIGDIYTKIESNVQGKFDNISGMDQLQRFAEHIRTIATGLSGVTVDIKGIQSLASGIGRLGSETVTAAAANIPSISAQMPTIRQLATDISGLGVVNPEGIRSIANALGSLGRKTVTAAASNVPILASALPNLYSMMEVLAEAPPINAENLTQLSVRLANLGKNTSKIDAANLDQIGTSISNIINRLNEAPPVREDILQLVTAVGSLNKSALNLGKSGKSLNTMFPKMGKSLNKVKQSSLSLAAVIGKLYAAFWTLRRVWRYGKEAVEFASDLVEVQNVVRNTFGENSEYLINDFAKSAISTYGMNELTAKQIASRFQSMGTALGYSKDQMADMSIQLTALAGDMASFYNAEYEDVGKDLQAIFTGMVKPLRKYGIDITQTTLEQWKLAQGVRVSMKEMTQAEKVALRYEYVMAHLSLTEGDFLKTIDTWANQIRMLKENIKMLGGVWGGAFINAFKPFVMRLNQFVNVVTDFSEKVINALGHIFGWKYEITGGGIADPFEDVEMADESASGLADGIGDAADNAKELAKSLTVLPFDELNQLNGDSLADDIGNGSGVGAGDDGVGDASGALLGTLERVEPDWAYYMSDIDNLFDLGRYISDALSESMESIDWNATYEKMRGWGKGLADFLNGLITPRLFGNVGTTIAGSLNSALNFLNQFGTTFNWKNFGISIATGINKYFRTADLVLAADTFNKYAHGILDALIAGVDELEWDEIGTKIGDALAELDVTGIAGKLLILASKIINGLLTAFSKSFEKAPLETIILTAFMGLRLTGLAGILSSAIHGGLVAGGFATALQAAIGPLIVMGLLAGYSEASKVVGDTLRGAHPELEGMSNEEILAVENEQQIRDLAFADVDDLYRSVHGKTAKDSEKDTSKMQPHTAGKKGFVNSPVISEQARAFWQKQNSDINEMLADYILAAPMPAEAQADINNSLKSIGNDLGTSLVKGVVSANIGKQLETHVRGAFVGGMGGSALGGITIIKPKLLAEGSALNGAFFKSITNGMDRNLNDAGQSWVKSMISGYNAKKPELINLATKLPGEIKNGIGNIAGALLPKGTESIEGIKTGWTNAKNSLLNFARSLGADINNNIGDIASAVKPKGIATLSGFISGWEERWPALATIAQALNVNIRNNIGDSASALVPAGSSAIQGVAQGIESGMSFVRNAAAAVAQNIHNNIPSNLYSEGYSAMNSYANGMQDVNVPAPHFVVKSYSDLLSGIGNSAKAHGATAMVPEIEVEWYAKGGFFPSPNVIGVGEAGNEAVLPLENPRVMRTIADSIMESYSGIDKGELRQIMTEAFTLALMNKPNDPINVYSTVMLENNEVLARSVSKGQRNIDYRQNPITKTVF